ncbi:hypothetical protein [Methylobacter psychrophilus]|uniref:hypothetical protein n=1 Tax=Methylobacter psychrophilus TaxID=96941 RepID=UPI0021D4FFA4|nr:hypothetical protein [Methylobacter psychrophilus]
MSKIEIQGDGVWILLQLLDEETASVYASKEQLTSDEFDDFMDESDGNGFGFYSSAEITVDDIVIGTVEDIINLGKNVPNGPILIEGLSKELELNIENGLVDVQSQDGTFVSSEIPDYKISEDGTPSNEFIKDFIQSISFDEDCCAFSLTEWNGIDLDDNKLTNGYTNLYLFYQGKQVEIGVNEDDDEED